MKTFPSNFITEKNKKTGASPVWILKCPFPSTGTIYLSDQTFTIATWNGGITTKAWIKSWGQIDENISGSELAASQVSDFAIEVIADPNVSPNIDTILWTAANNIETTDLELYLWFTGLNPATDPPQLLWVGNIVDFQRQDELSYSLQMADQSVRLDKIIGTVIDATTYPNADPDEIGKVANILYGATKQVRCQSIASGAIDTIPADITATSPGNSGALQISDASEFPASGAFTIQIDYEKIQIASRSGNTLTLAASGARGYSGTTPAAHNKGAAAYQLITQFVYLIADHPVKTIGDILVDGVGQTTGFATYTGQPGNELSGYYGKAVLVFTVKPVLMKQVNLTVNEGAHLHSQALLITAVKLEDTTRIQGSGFANDSLVYDGDFQSGAVNIDSTTISNFYRITPASNGVATRIRGKIMHGHASYIYGTADLKVIINGVTKTTKNIPASGTKTVSATDWVDFTNWNNLIATNTYLQFVATSPGNSLMVWDIWWEVEYNPSTASSGATGVALTGASVADTVIGSEIVANVDGYQDNASGDYTGTANALIEQPNHVIKHLLNVYAGVALANFSTNTDSYFSANAYKFSIVINERKKLKEWLADMAWQCRAYFRFAAGKAYLTLRPDSLTTQKSLTANMIRMQDDFKTTLKVARSPLEEIINKIKIYYNRDWLKTGADAYKAISSTSDTTSITRYGEKEKPDLFFFDFITLLAMANDVRDFYLTRYKTRKKLIEMEVFLDNSEIDFADALTIVPQGSLLAEVQKVNLLPGSGKDMRNDKITLVAKEY